MGSSNHGSLPLSLRIPFFFVSSCRCISEVSFEFFTGRQTGVYREWSQGYGNIPFQGRGGNTTLTKAVALTYTSTNTLRSSIGFSCIVKGKLESNWEEAFRITP